MGLDTDTAAAAQDWPTQNVGLRAASFPAIDIDTSTTDALRLVEEIVQRVAPGAATAPVRYRDGSPRALYPFRLAPGSDLCGKDGWRGWTRTGRPTRSMCLVSVSNMRSRVRTRPGRSMNGGMGGTSRAVGATELPVLTRDTVDAFIQALQEAIAADGRDRHRGVSQARGSGGQSDRLREGRSRAGECNGARGTQRYPKHGRARAVP